MKKLNYLMMLAIVSFLSFSLISCDDDDDDNDDGGNQTIVFELTQELWDSATTLIEENISGEAGGAGNHAAGDTTINLDNALRDVYTNMANASDEAIPGDIIIKLTYNSEDGSVDTKNAKPNVGFAMIKQAEGIADETGNWTWFGVRTDENGDLDLSTKFTPDPNGCWNCHSGSSNDGRLVPTGS